jgi:hypothetical protein
MWQRGAMWQGAHMSLLRSLTDALVLSAYHGPHVTDVLRRVDYCRAVNEDVRPRIGDALLGASVFWPEANPSPEPSRLRRGLGSVARFLEQLERSGVRVLDESQRAAAPARSGQCSS